MKAFEAVHQENMEAAQLNADTQAWLNGQYVLLAIGAGLNGKPKYPSEPFSVKHHSETQVEENPEEAERKKARKNAQMLEIWAINYNISKGHEPLREVKDSGECRSNSSTEGV